MSRVEFVSYTGKWPCLCHGVLTLKIDGNTILFGHEPNSYIYSENRYNDNNYNSFWHSGGNCGFTNNYSNSYINRAPWDINAKELPEQYRELADEIEKEINANMTWGCCGGCL